MRQRCGILVWSLLLLLVACARVRPLSGGAEDVTPPALLTASPVDSSSGIDRNTVFHYTFGERLDRASALVALRTYPHLARREVEVKGSHVTLRFPDSLPADTTFVVVFGEDLADQQPRGNTLHEEMWFVYSTSDTLRSGALFGRVATRSRPEPDGAVQYEPIPPDTTDPRHRPRYPVATANDEGLFRMLGLPVGRRFVLRGFADRNHNRIADLDELQSVYPETLVLAPGQIRRGLQWNLIDPNEKANLTGVVINRTGVEGRVAVALRLLDPKEPETAAGTPRGQAAGSPEAIRGSQPGPIASGLPPPEQLPPDSVRIGLAALPVQERQQSGYESAYAALDSTGFEASEWRITYATLRGDYAIKVAPGHHWIVAFVDAARDSVPGLYVTPDSTQRAWEPFWTGDTLFVTPGEERRLLTIDLEPRTTPGP